MMRFFLLLLALVMAGDVSAQVNDNKAIARRYFDEILNKGNAAAIDALIAEDIVFRNPPVVLKSRAEFHKLVAGLRAAFPDVHFTLQDEIAEGDKVATRWIMRRTQNGKMTEVTGMDIFRIAGGKVREVWVNMESSER